MDYEKLRDTRNSTNPYARKLGITVEEIGPGSGEDGQSAADLSEIFALTDGGNFFTGVSPLETAEAAT